MSTNPERSGMTEEQRRRRQEQRRRRLEQPRQQVNRKSLSQLRRLGQFVKPYRRYLALALLGVMAASVLGLVFPQVMGSLVDTALAGLDNNDTTELDRIALILIAVFAGQALFNVLRVYYAGIMGEAIVADLRKGVYRHLMTLPVTFFDQRKTGEITSRLTSDVAVVQATVSTALAQAFAQGFTLLGGVVLMFLTSFRLSLTVLSFLPIAVVAARLFGRRLRQISTQFQDRVAEANSYAEEAISANRVVKWFTAEEIEIERYTGAVDKSYQVARRRAKLQAIFNPSVTFVAFGTLAVVMWVGGRQVLDGQLTAGSLVTFLLYTVTVAGAIGSLTGLYAQLQQTLGATHRIFQLLDERSDVVEPENPVHLESVEGRLSFEDVSFAYSDRDVDVLSEVTLKVEPGERLAIVGPSGAGKSTLVQLIPRFFDPDEGRILLDGVDLKDLVTIDARKHMAAVPQETQLFSGTIAENLRVAKPHASDNELHEAALAANAHDFIVEFPDGYDTLVGERGVKLSGGQRQRVAIARALLKDPRILILDEATSSLDSEAEALVQEALERLMEGRTSLVIAHRLSTVRDADRIIVVDRGRIVQEGTHDALLEQGGLYAELSARQFVDEPNSGPDEHPPA